MTPVSSSRSQSYQIKSGDTLSEIAQRNGTSVSALMKANPQIKDADKIYTGKTLSIPGVKDGFDASRPGGTGGTRSPGATGGPQGPSHAPEQVPDLADAGPGTRGPGGNPADIARGHLGKNASSLKLERNGVGSDMDDGIPNNVNCANFVSACLEQAGQISNSQHHNSVVGLSGNLDRDPNFSRVSSLSQAKPGDVVSFNTPGGGHHVVMFAGMENGRPQFIGSNNVNSDGSQRISLSSMNYPIMSIHHYNG